MKKINYVILLLFIVGNVFAQGKKFETVIKMKTEHEYSQRIENALEPFIGKTVVVTKLTLEYPTLLKNIITEFENRLDDENAKITKSKAAIMSKDLKKEDIDETRIIKKDIIIYVDKMLSAKQLIFVRTNVSNWFRLKSIDKLDIVKALVIPETENLLKGDFQQENVTEQSSSSSTNKVYLFLAFLLFALIVVYILMFNSGMSKLALARHNVTVTGFDKLIGAFANMSLGSPGKGGSGGGEQEIKSTDALSVRLLQDKRNPNRGNFDFHFLERLSFDSLYNIIITESLENAAFILSSLSKNYTASFFEEYADKIHNITAHMLTKIIKTKNEVEKLRKKVFDKFLKLLENEPFLVDGAEEIIHIINKLSVKKSNELFEQIKKLDSTVAKDIRERIFLQEDIDKLNENQLEFIVLAIDHDLLARFISISDKGLSEKFYNNMTDRNKNIIKEDLDMFEEFSPKEREEILDRMLREIRKVLKFI